MSAVPDARPTPGPTTPGAGRRVDDHVEPQRVRDLLRSSLQLPLRPLTRTTAVLAAAVVAAETTGLVVRQACRRTTCGDWATRLDIDALGSLPRTLITLLLAAVALTCLRAVWRAGRQGAGLWWATLAVGGAALAGAKHWSVHSLLEERLGALVPGADVQLLFLVVSVLGLGVAVVSGRWVRRDTRTAVVTWLGLYALASVGLAAVTVVLQQWGTTVADVASWVEETGEGLAAVGLLAAVRAGVTAVSRRTSGASLRTPVTENT